MLETEDDGVADHFGEFGCGFSDSIVREGFGSMISIQQESTKWIRPQFVIFLFPTCGMHC